jgi:hypothetical protein
VSVPQDVEGALARLLGLEVPVTLVVYGQGEKILAGGDGVQEVLVEPNGSVADLLPDTRRVLLLDAEVRPENV